MAELENYEFQLSQVEDALQKDPGNEKLEKLKSELTELIDLYRSIETKKEEPVQKEQQKKIVKKPLKEYEIGETILARYSDSNYYEALIVGVSETHYELIFTGYDTIVEIEKHLVKEGKEGKNPTLLSSKDIVVGDIKEKPNAKIQKVQKKKKKRKDDVEQTEKQEKWKAFLEKQKKRK
ncbi:hypothetical protein HK103_003057 [Boothiomyces macroporosus]|uniref:Survival of motor neuron-related-splicing factor 30 n=1 Tax=Boothiomyces macroporosus TaxID=261099 RepID=A0AAD5U950_9FUNG|nr:hypothetical protein HK103_003057 [Boothiomyces macroporosus]